MDCLALAGHHLCLDVDLAFANSASLQKGLISEEWDIEKVKSAENLNEQDYGRVRNATFGAQTLSAFRNWFPREMIICSPLQGFLSQNHLR